MARTVSCSPDLCTSQSHRDQMAPGQSPPTRLGWEVAVFRDHLSLSASLQVQNVHGAFNALGGADRLTSNRKYPIIEQTSPPGVLSHSGNTVARGAGGLVRCLLQTKVISTNHSFPTAALSYRREEGSLSLEKADRGPGISPSSDTSCCHYC